MMFIIKSLPTAIYYVAFVENHKIYVLSNYGLLLNIHELCMYVIGTIEEI